MKKAIGKKVSVLAALASLTLVLPPLGALRAAKYPPGLHWREIGRGGITVIFPAGRSAEAAAALAAAEALAGKLARFWGYSLRGGTRIVLGDFSDDANGFATFFPFNLIGIDLAEPPPDSEIAAAGGWLDLVLAHELTHLFTLGAGAPPFVSGRRLFGTNPALYPAAQLPPWAIEGLAVEGESRLTGAGRLNRAPYRLMLEAARRDGTFPGWRSLSGLPAAWPGGTAKYLFGAGFMEFLAEKYGTAGLRSYLERFSSRFLTLGASRDFRNIFGKPLGELWDEYREGKRLQRRPPADPVTRDGFANRYPCVLADGGVAYYHRDYRGHGEVRLVDRDGSERVLFKQEAVGSLAAGPQGGLILSATEAYRSFHDFSDLYEYDLEKGSLKRLSKGKRLSHPAWAPARPGEPERIYCVERRDNRSRLAIFDPEGGVARSVSMAFAGMAQVAISPGGTLLAAAAKPAGGPWGIAVFLPSGGLESFLSLAGCDLSQPRWRADGKLLFLVTGRDDSFLAAWSREAGGAWRLDEPLLNGTRQFDISGDGREIVFAYHSGRGEEIARTAAEWIPQSPLEISVATEIPDAGTAPLPAAAPFSRPYRFWRDLLPRWWSPAWRAGGDEIQAGAMTGGQDALGIHSYSLEGYYGFNSRRANFLFRYVYDGLFPTLSLSYRDETDDQGYFLRTQELKLASLWPLRLRKRSQLYAYADLHAERLSQISGHDHYAFSGSDNGLRLGLDFNSAREYHDSISPSDGVRFTLQGAIHPEGLGNRWASRSVQADLRHYIPLFRPGVLAWRLALARSWDQRLAPYVMGGREGEAGTSLGNSHPFDLLRGFQSGYQYGDRGFLFNLEYRLPLFKIERAVVPAFSLERVYLNPFFDMGRLVNRYDTPKIASSAGAEVVLRLAFGGAAATDLAFGVAHGFGTGVDLWLYVRMGRSF